ncbi:MAG: divalent metal cation transporter [Sphingomonas sp.]
MENGSGPFDSEQPSDIVGSSKPRLFGLLGPGLITGASDDDPSGIATYSQAGAMYGTGLGWAMVLTYPLMSAIQEISARIGRTTGHGIAGNLRRHQSPWVLNAIVILLLVANVINIGADLGAMADATTLIAAGPAYLYALGFGVLCIVLQIWVQYASYVKILKWLTLVLFAYPATLLLVHVPWSQVAHDIIIPKIVWNKDYIALVVAVFGTTISPYLFFWQASEEAEDIRELPKRHALKNAVGEGPAALHRIRFDTFIGMAFSNLVALAIILTTAVTLHAHGVGNIATSAQAASALKPIAGNFAFMLFTIGIVGTGVLAVPVLAGSAAYAIGEARDWPTGLARKPREAKAFYATLAAATAIGIVIDLTPINPIKALIWSAIINGVVAVPVMAIMMVMARRSRIMGVFTIGPVLTVLGWAATAIMAIAAVAMVVTSF